jgi:hypothetical protein
MAQASAETKIAESQVAKTQGVPGVALCAGVALAAAGTHTPGYPTMRLFRQKQRGDWTDVFAAIAEAVRMTIAARQA